jgi:hypothetical protein
MEQLLQHMQQQDVLFWLWFVPLLLISWFLPTLLALFFNRKHLKLIALANIPAGLSVVAWGGCMVWAVTGKIWQKTSATPTESREPD